MRQLTIDDLLEHLDKLEELAEEATSPESELRAPPVTEMSKPQAIKELALDIILNTLRSEAPIKHKTADTLLKLLAIANHTKEL